MGKFLQGLLVGAAAGLLIAPMKGEELRNQLEERFKKLQHRVSSSNLPLTSIDAQRVGYSKSGDSGEAITLPPRNMKSPKPDGMSSSKTTSQPFTGASTTGKDVPVTGDTTNMSGIQSTSNSGMAESTTRPATFNSKSSTSKPDTTSTPSRPEAPPAIIKTDATSETAAQHIKTTKPGTTPTRRYTYERAWDEEDNDPIIFPVETFENPKSAHTTPESTNASNSNNNRPDQSKRTTNSHSNNKTRKF
ncbi:hypothetical protein KDA_64770 [Dictyobacter alpinus]|uniref:YtxH domain-containing protein n=1 Tax=Dictyobacter alpinus TaxID=2014873 RepID=A0A402BHZ6_9CHLR|nr:YtxH domain-containing protein [Dictyobacter alpinus]GCE30993.1 hypothetical protein KDA_64770 [Dictyobacter alpinus]